ncbi:MAG TPA: DNA repair protein RecO [Gemmatimonadaceae bacterium]|nr:DNA repair protein RecO [Gemmatimonadaceae bacterium]
MPAVATDAIVLHVRNYLESSRILRLITRDHGVQSVLARGARRPKSRFGAALDLFAQGTAQLELRPGRDLQTLSAFEVTRVRVGLASDLERFSAAATLSECLQRLVTEEHAPSAFALTARALEAIATAPSERLTGVTLGALWALVAEVGLAPSLSACASCDRPVGPEETAAFSHAAGGVLCAECASRAPGARRLPPSARDAIAAWLSDEPEAVTLASDAEGRAHQRLLREFLGQHVVESRLLRAWAAWEQAGAASA